MSLTLFRSRFDLFVSAPKIPFPLRNDRTLGGVGHKRKDRCSSSQPMPPRGLVSDTSLGGLRLLPPSNLSSSSLLSAWFWAASKAVRYSRTARDASSAFGQLTGPIARRPLLAHVRPDQGPRGLIQNPSPPTSPAAMHFATTLSNIRRNASLWRKRSCRARLKHRMVGQREFCNTIPPIAIKQPTSREVAMGHVRHFTPQKSSEPFRRRTTVKSVTDLPIVCRTCDRA